jgi:HSP20 family protein
MGSDASRLVAGWVVLAEDLQGLPANPSPERAMNFPFPHIDPFRERLLSEVTRLFDDRLMAHASEIAGWVPRADIYEDAEGLTLKLDLPEVAPAQIEMRVENGVLTVRGERKLEREEKKSGYHRIERQYGTFSRSFSLPATMDTDRVRAEAKNGVLRVHVPRRSETKTRQVAIKVEG